MRRSFDEAHSRSASEYPGALVSRVTFMRMYHVEDAPCSMVVPSVRTYEEAAPCSAAASSASRLVATAAERTVRPGAKFGASVKRPVVPARVPSFVAVMR